MTDIQRARDVLKKWRDRALPDAWSDDHITALLSQRDGRLIVGTAGNPDLLNAIDYMLATEQNHQLTSFAPVMPNLHAERIAAAIIAADEWMTQ